MPNSTLSRRIGELEKSIGLRLMNRTTRKLELTEAGRVYSEAVADEVARGNLRQIMPDWQGRPLPVYILTESRLLPAKAQRFIEFLSGRLKRLRP